MHSDDQVIAHALEILASRLVAPEAFCSSPSTVKDFLRLKLAQEEREVFGVLWMTSQNGVIKYEEIFFGTLSQATVYPREIVKAALAVNAASAIFVHNHPSGIAEPSRADESLTEILKKALALVDVKVLDHIIVGGMQTMSFAERGLI